MRTVRLDHQFDAVFIHDAIVYMTTEADVRAAIETAFLHCRPGGAALFAPDHLRENFAEDTEHGGHDDDDEGRRLAAVAERGGLRGPAGAARAPRGRARTARGVRGAAGRCRGAWRRSGAREIIPVPWIPSTSLAVCPPTNRFRSTK
jgi:hypothetical protein